MRVQDEHQTAHLFAAARMFDRAGQFAHFARLAQQIEMARFRRPRDAAQFHDGVSCAVQYITGNEPEVTYKLSRDFYDTFMWASSAKAETELGYKHRPARKTLARAIRWYLDRGYVDPSTAAEIRYDDLPGPDPAPSLPHERNAVYREG